MKTNFVNQANIRGYIFSHSLVQRTSGSGNEYIRGNVNIATDDKAMNVVPVYFFEFATRRNGNANQTYQALQGIIDGKVKTFETVGASATHVRVDGDIDVNDWVNRDGELVSTKRVRGKFIHELDANEAIGDSPSRFEADMLVQSAAIRESVDGSDYMELKGFVFSYGKNILPITLSVMSEQGMDFFNDQNISPSAPFFSKVSGEFVTSTVVTQREEDASDIGFGAPEVQTSTRSLHIWNVTRANVNLGLDEATITADELKAALAKREDYLTSERKRWEERQGASGGTTAATSGFTSAAPAAAPAKSISDFKF